MTIKAIDLFAGIGGFHLALHNLNVDVVFASEWDKYARETYIKNFTKISPKLFQNNNYAGDITEVKAELIPDFDILTGGFPCQPFSHAGKGGGFSDTRGTLFFNVADILKTKQPAAFFLENVRGLLTHDDGKTFKVIQNTIKQLGYSFDYKIVKGTDFNIPQHRPRVYLVGFREDLENTFEWETPIPLTYTLDKILGGKVTNPNGTEKKIGYTLRVGGRNSGVHDRRNWDAYIVDGKARALTLDEAKKLQGFPDWYEFPVSNTQAFKQLGNAVVVPAIQGTAKQIIQVLNRNNIF